MWALVEFLGWVGLIILGSILLALLMIGLMIWLMFTIQFAVEVYQDLTESIRCRRRG